MNLEKVTNPLTLPVTLQSVKDHLRIDGGESAFDSQIEELIWAAVEFIEGRTHLRFINTQYRAKWNRFPCGPDYKTQDILIPLFPVVSVDTLQYYDIAGTLTTLTGYQTELIQTPCRVVRGIGESWPETQDEKINAVILTFTAGYGTSHLTVPYQARHLVKLMVAHWFKNAEAVLTGTISKEIELAFESLKNQLRVNEFQEFLR